MVEYKPAITVDAIGLFCPIPIVKVKLGIEKVKADEVVELLADDPGVLEDLPVWCEETGNKLLSLKKTNEIFIGYVKKTKQENFINLFKL